MLKNFIHGDNSQETFKNPQRLHVKQYVKLIIMYTKKENYEWVIGFIDGDGFIDLERIKNRDRFYYRPILSITQKNIKTLYKIKKILKIGRITKGRDGYYHYRVRSRRLFEQYLVPIFTKYPFLSNKKLQFKLIVRCLRILKDYTDQDSQKQRCLNQIQIWIREARLRRLKTEPKNLSQTWLVGFFDSEGCISVSPLRGKQQSSKEASLKWRFVIKISQSKTNYLLLVAIRDFLNIGRIYKERSNIYYWGSHSFKDLSKLKSLFKKYPLKSEKHIQWIRFLKLLQIKDNILQKPHLLKPNQKKLERLILSFQKQLKI